MRCATSIWCTSRPRAARATPRRCPRTRSTTARSRPARSARRRRSGSRSRCSSSRSRSSSTGSPSDDVAQRADAHLRRAGHLLAARAGADRGDHLHRVAVAGRQRGLRQLRRRPPGQLQDRLGGGALRQLPEVVGDRRGGRRDRCRVLVHFERLRVRADAIPRLAGPLLRVPVRPDGPDRGRDRAALLRLPRPLADRHLLGPDPAADGRVGRVRDVLDARVLPRCAAVSGRGGADRRRVVLVHAVARFAAPGAAGRADHDRAAVHVDLERVPAGAGDGVPGGPAHRAARAELLPGAQHLEPDAAGGGRGDRGDPGGDRVRVPAAALHPRHVERGGEGLAMAEVRFDEVGKAFGEVQAVRELSLDIADGEFMVLVGPSGSGKTTALRMLAGLESVTSGSVFIGDALVNRVAPRERDIAMVFQDYALYPQMTVFDNLAFGLRRRKTPKDEIGRRVEEAAASLDLGPYLQRQPGQLSGGPAQRVALGRALVRDPQVFLMDEPLSNLDAKLRTQTRGEIKRLQQEVRTTTVYVTHDQVEAMTMGDRIAVMNHGLLEQVGTPEELYERPANRFVAGFIGSPAMSFFDPAELGLNGDARSALAGVRPEHARPWREGLLGPLQGRVAFVEALGRETFIGVDVSGARLVVFEEGRAPRDVGETIEFGLVPTGLRYFDADTGAAL